MDPPVAENQSPTGVLPTIFTAQSKRYFYCRDAVCEFVFLHGGVPVNPFRVFEYFLGDRVDRDLVRQGNNNLIRVADELWVFGDVIADGVLFEVLLANRLGKPVRFHTIATRSADIKMIPVESLRFEPGVYKKGWKRDGLIRLIRGDYSPNNEQGRMFDPEDNADGSSASVIEIKRHA